jgi:hypothetical protein
LVDANENIEDWELFMKSLEVLLSLGFWVNLRFSSGGLDLESLIIFIWVDI